MRRRLFLSKSRKILLDPCRGLLHHKLRAWMPPTGLGAYMRKTPAGARFYMDLVRDRLDGRAQDKLRTARNPGRPPMRPATTVPWRDGCSNSVQADSTPASSPTPSILDGLSHRISVKLTADSRSPRLDWPVTIPLKQLAGSRERLQSRQLRRGRPRTLARLAADPPPDRRDRSCGRQGDQLPG